MLKKRELTLVLVALFLALFVFAFFSTDDDVIITRSLAATDWSGESSNFWITGNKIMHCKLLQIKVKYCRFYISITFISRASLFFAKKIAISEAHH